MGEDPVEDLAVLLLTAHKRCMTGIDNSVSQYNIKLIAS